MSSKKFKLIAVDKANYEALQKLGHVPESFNDVVSRLLKNQNQNQTNQTNQGQNNNQTLEKSETANLTPLQLTGCFQNDIQGAKI